MTHSQQYILREDAIKEIEFIRGCLKNASPWCGDFIRVMELLDISSKNISNLPQSPSVESLLEEMGASMHQMRDWSRDWKAYIQLDNFDTYHEAYWKTPILALLALKEKLNNNNQ